MVETRVIAVIACVIVVVAALGYYATRPAELPGEEEEEEEEEEEKIRMAVVYITPIEEPWNSALHEAMMEAVDELNIEYGYQESVAVADVERVLRSYVEEGYDLIWAHSYGFGDAARNVGADFPDAKILHGSGLEVTANVGIYDYWIHEATYLEGLIAGMMTQTNKLGIVGGYPTPDVDILMNAFIEGAHDVNEDVEVMVSFIESWYDPPKATEYARTQIELDADFLFAERHGVISACVEEDVYAFGNIIDQYDEGPDVVITSAVWNLYPFVEEMVNRIEDGTWTAKNYVWGMSEGCSDIAPYYGLDATIPTEVKSAVADAKQEILAGELVVLVDPQEPKDAWPDVVISA